MTQNGTTRRTPTPDLPGGTRVLGTLDGEPGCILNGYRWDATGECIEYEVETIYHIELWKRVDFLLMSEVETALENEEA